MRIGIDIDGVLTDMEQFIIDHLSKYCVENNLNFNIGTSNYQVSKTFNITSEQEDDFWNEYVENYAINEKARPFASEVIKKLKEDGSEIYIITARWLTNRDDDIGNKMREIVKNWLIKNEIVYDKLIFSKAENERKSQEIIDNEIDLMIEDNPRNIKELSNIVPIICYNAEYNRECIGENITRCYSWYDIYRTIGKGENILKELIDVLDENGNRTGEILTKEQIHKKGLCHRIVVIAIIDVKGNILMQQRSKNKTENPEKWDVSVAGHVSSGETSVQSAIRETLEEVGIKVNEKELEYILTYKDKENIGEDYIDNQIYDCYIVRKQKIELKDIKIQESEVEQVKLCNLKEFIEIIESENIMKRDELYKRIIEYLK